MFRTVYTDVLPLIRASYATKVQLIFRQQIQPWHPSSTLTHEAAIAVLLLAPDKFWEFSRVLFERQKEFFDGNVVLQPRNETYKRLAEIADGVGVEGGKVYGLLKVKEGPDESGALNTGNGTTDVLKRVVRAARVTGVHVSPTVFFDGIEERGIESSFTKEQWGEWLEKNVK